MKYLSKKCTVVAASRRELKRPNAINILRKVVGQETFSIIDIGGYFAPRLSEIQKILRGNYLK